MDPLLFINCLYKAKNKHTPLHVHTYTQASRGHSPEYLGMWDCSQLPLGIFYISGVGFATTKIIKVFDPFLNPLPPSHYNPVSILPFNVKLLKRVTY